MTHVAKHPTTRRNWLVHSTLSVVALGNPAPGHGSITIVADQPLTTTTSIPPECQNGALVAESAIPGAYDQICMNLPVRTIPISSQVKLQIQQEGVGPGKTGLAVWNSALLLARLLTQITKVNPTWLHQQRVAELGCGAGLVSLLLAQQAGARSVWATDGNPDAVALTRTNFERNGIAYRTTTTTSDNQNVVTQLKWGELEVPVEWMGQVDVLVGSDLTYNSGSWRLLAETMESLLAPNGICIYLSLGHAGFNVAGEVDGFVNVAQQVGLFSKSKLPLPGSSLDALLASVIRKDSSEPSIMMATGGAQVVVLGRKNRI
ncbi:histidine protein methyltransferase 1 homolog [Seminavis robusta]|uniref:Histidine protein methyltransferase 1 homolog n=1 Tax=Seminavis robusta TaxID=568900 RepID=A0A9N8H6R8_9STRA|nr:histidine protein methyltransferase 1 homolog [Seminavis robusta]|eukprot:Sro108_g054150.1 histidine protein methyltransferase 1 homolog (318) ;mRNA; r:45740-46804